MQCLLVKSLEFPRIVFILDFWANKMVDTFMSWIDLLATHGNGYTITQPITILLFPNHASAKAYHRRRVYPLSYPFHANSKPDLDDIVGYRIILI